MVRKGAGEKLVSVPLSIPRAQRDRLDAVSAYLGMKRANLCRVAIRIILYELTLRDLEGFIAKWEGQLK